MSRMRGRNAVVPVMGHQPSQTSMQMVDCKADASQTPEKSMVTFERCSFGSKGLMVMLV